jgi:hypothetical protein
LRASDDPPQKAHMEENKPPASIKKGPVLSWVCAGHNWLLFEEAGAEERAGRDVGGWRGGKRR